MNPPADLSLPFFAYGLFQPGQIAYFPIRQYVQRINKHANAKGELRIRDGLPIMDADGPGTCEGVILHFEPNGAAEAYDKIAGLEPDKQYRWGKTIVNKVETNVLFGRNPKKGSISLKETDETTWNGWNDPLFMSALEVIQEIVDSNRDSAWDLKPLFRLQMAYLLLWSSIERYLSLRYHLARNVTAKIHKLADEVAFATAVRRHVSGRRYVVRADEPQEKVELDPNRPQLAVNYYYQVRSNVTHRGKGVHRDHGTLLRSISELLTIFRYVLDQAKADASA